MNMAKQYSRKQIVEAIKHWQNVLKTLDENVVVNKLYDVFGDAIFSTKYNYTITANDVKLIQQTLCNCIFDKKLTCLPISIVSIDYMRSQSKIPFKGRIQHCYKIVNPNKIIVIPKQIQIVAFNGKDNLTKIISVVAHELIHQYDYLYGIGSIVMPLEKQMASAGIDVKDKYDVHGKFFKYHMDRINHDFDLNVEISYDETNMKAMNRNNLKPIEIVDKSTLNESDDEKAKKYELARYLSQVFANDGNVSIEIDNDGVNVWTI